ncbi:MAG TPA: type II toxin-antitoxin system VapC family toxin [Candidatus Lokiarchaeia archaeon]|nr:type II toxin-antitoxin system VapC family toxin [Candidatus Lokiarchaeia archaeon]
MSYLLDTNIIIGVLRKKPSILGNYVKLTETSPTTFISSYTIAELFEGLYRSNIPEKKAEEETILELMFEDFEQRDRILSLKKSHAATYAHLKILLDDHGTPIPIIDLLIGSIAIGENLILITTDKKHFQALKKIEPRLTVKFW